MDKKDKQKMMIDGAVFESISKLITFRHKSCPFLDNNGDDISTLEWEEMTLKTPPPKPEYSRDYEIIPPHRMAYLMEVEGLRLEYGTDSFFYFDKDNVIFKYKTGSRIGNLTCGWSTACRVYQEPKMETRWLWEKEGSFSCAKTHKKYSVDAMKNEVHEFAEWDKIEESAEQFPVDAK